MNLNSSLNESVVNVPLCLTFDNSYSWKSIKILVKCIITLYVLYGNVLVLGIFYKFKQMRRSTTNKFIFNMAVCDFARSIFYLPINLASAIADSVKWLIGGDFGLFLCKLFPFVGEVTIAVSILTLVVIAVDRFYAILFPLRKGILTQKVCQLTIILTWILAIGLYSSIFYTAKLDDHGTCIMDWGPYFDDYKTQKHYYISLFVILYAVPLSLITILYLAIFFELHKSTTHECNGFHEQERRKENKRILQMLVSVVILFALTWAPLHVYAFLRYFYINTTLNSHLICQMHALQIITVFTMNFGCAINPFLYFIFLEKYRNNLKVVLVYLLNKKPSKLLSSTANEKTSERFQACSTYDWQETTI